MCLHTYLHRFSYFCLAAYAGCTYAKPTQFVAFLMERDLLQKSPFVTCRRIRNDSSAAPAAQKLIIKMPIRSRNHQLIQTHHKHCIDVSICIYVYIFRI